MLLDRHYGGVGVLNENICVYVALSLVFIFGLYFGDDLKTVLAVFILLAMANKLESITNCIKRGRFDCGREQISMCFAFGDVEHAILLSIFVVIAVVAIGVTDLDHLFGLCVIIGTVICVFYRSVHYMADVQMEREPIIHKHWHNYRWDSSTW
eukprot:727566_1